MKVPLEYYIHDGPTALRFDLRGSLSGSGAESVHNAWQAALSVIGERSLIVDITFVADVDDRGRALLELWHRSGTRIIAASRESRALAKAVLDEPDIRDSGGRVFESNAGRDAGSDSRSVDRQFK
jgi:hypothetical protein